MVGHLDPGTTAAMTDLIMGSSSTQRSHSLSDPKGRANEVPVMPSVLSSCHDLFGSHQIVRNGNCLHHRLLQWLACEISSSTTAGSGKDSNDERVWINPTLIQGSVGGEEIEDILNRPEDEEKLKFSKGSLIVHNLTSIQPRLVQSVDMHMRRFLQSAATKNVLDGLHVNRQDKKNSTEDASTFTSSDITLLVRRGGYANPCMALLTMYNTYIVLEHYYDYFQRERKSPHHSRSLKIVWLDGHAKGDLDPVWQRLFHTQPVHIKQLESQSSTTSRSDSQGPTSDIEPRGGVMLSRHVMVVNTMSAIGDEGMGLYQWGGYNPKNDEKRPDRRSSDDHGCWKNSTLVHFRDFVLEHYGLKRRTFRDQESSSPKKLTFLVRKNYRAHPRSTGETDRTIADVEADAAYLQTLYPFHAVQVVSFEGMPFSEQLEYIIETDILVAVHGAGNIHVLFLPDEATLVEYIPKSFQNRRRFRFLAECLNVKYIARTAWIEGRKSWQHAGTTPPPPLMSNNSNSTGNPLRIRDNSGNQQHAVKDLIQVRLRPPPNGSGTR